MFGYHLIRSVSCLRWDSVRCSHMAFWFCRKNWLVFRPFKLALIFSLITALQDYVSFIMYLSVDDVAVDAEDLG